MKSTALELLLHITAFGTGFDEETSLQPYAEHIMPPFATPQHIFPSDLHLGSLAN